MRVRFMSLDSSAVHEKESITLHSCCEAFAAIIIYFFVSISDKPAEEGRHIGKGKVEILSALIETFLLLITSAWPILNKMKVLHE